MTASATDDQIERFTLRASDVVITKDSEDAADIAVPAYVPEDLPGIVCGYHLGVIRPRKGLLGSFVANFFRGSVLKAMVEVRANGLTRVGLGHDAVTSLPVPTPPVPEQQAIANFLDAETSKIDGLIAEQRRLVELLGEKRQAVISHAVTKGLNPDAPLKPSGIEWLGDVPKHWEVVRVKYLTRILRGKFTHRPRNDPRMYDGPYPFIQTGEISPTSRYVGEHHQTLSEDGFKVSKEFPAGTLVMTITGAGTANVAILNFEACFPDSIVGFVPTDGVSIDYLYNLFIAMREALLSTAVTNTQPNLNIERIGALFTVNPPLAEQDAIIEAIERESSNYDTLIAKAERAIELLQERRTALISAAVTGKIDVRGYDPHLTTTPGGDP